ncbi:MAG TPA: hypothetical protein VFI25_06430 [Planctomycetota bacterium]|jgi:hypothetical protein|nr:hypothetical protein [Planctomycetota bacterium]
MRARPLLEAVSLLSCAALVGLPARGQSPTALFTLTGSSPNEFFGGIGAGLGDLDADGIPDFAVGAEGADPPGLTDAGQVRVFSGATGGLLFTLNGEQSGYGVYMNVAGAGDVNGDGVPDVLVGWPEASAGNLGNAGRVRVFSGADGALLQALNGTAAGELFGFSLAGLGDVNGDAHADFAVGETGWGANPSYLTHVRAYSGASGSVLTTLNAATPGDGFGISVDSAGDVNGDGLEDLVVGANYAVVAGFPACGHARVFSATDGALLWTFDGSVCGNFGMAVAGVGDLNADGKSEVLIGAPTALALGQAEVFSGATGATLYTFDGTSSPGYLGDRVCGPGDLEGDGVPDFAIGSHVGAGYLAVYSGASGVSFATLTGSELSSAVAGVGDLDGDGAGELLVGEDAFVSSGMGYVGRARVFSFDTVPSATFGSWCPGAGGFVPQIASVGLPNVGNASFAVQVSQTSGGALTVLIIGDSNTTWAAAGIALPWNLASLGMPACNLRVAPLAYLATFASGSGPGAGTASYPLPVPNVPAMVGDSVLFQGWTSVTGLSLVPGALTAGLRVTVVP